jgi:hypothetical protein
MAPAVEALDFLKPKPSLEASIRRRRGRGKRGCARMSHADQWNTRSFVDRQTNNFFKGRVRLKVRVPIGIGHSRCLRQLPFARTFRSIPSGFTQGIPPNFRGASSHQTPRGPIPAIYHAAPDVSCRALRAAQWATAFPSQDFYMNRVGQIEDQPLGKASRKPIDVKQGECFCERRSGMGSVHIETQ